MSNSKEFRNKKDQAFEAYLSGITDAKDLAKLVGASPVTVSKWIKAGKWQTLQKEESSLNRKLEVARKRCLLAALEEYAKKPADTSLQSLVGLLKSEQKRTAPSKELNDYIVKFMDQQTDFLVEKGYEALLQSFRPIILELAEYLRGRNS